jgi:hypothetical protein
MRLRLFAVFAVLAGLGLAVLPASADVDVIRGGIDLWQTPADGSTYADFSSEPIPAGFFCLGSEPFTGKIVFRGAPIATGTPGSLGPADTIVVRLDDARFDSNGVATTRVQLQALSLVGVAPIKTTCGSFVASASLAGQQPVTTMQIVRENGLGGHFVAPLALNVRVVFTPADRQGGKPRALQQSITFQHEGATWSSRPGKGGLEVRGSVLVDTDGDHRTDTRLPGTSNFFPGWQTGHDGTTVIAPPNCHCDPSSTFGAASAAVPPPCAHLHCPGGVYLD